MTIKLFAAFVVAVLAMVAALAFEAAMSGQRAAGAATPFSTNRPDTGSGSDGASTGGTVTYFNGDPAAGLEVALFTSPTGSSDDRYLRPAFTDGNGTYRFDDLPADCYYLVFQAPDGAAFDGGAATIEQDTCLDPGQTGRSVDVVLASGRPGSPFALNILHIGDHNSRLTGQRLEFDLGDESIEVEVGGMARVATEMTQRSAAITSAPGSAPVSGAGTDADPGTHADSESDPDTDAESDPGPGLPVGSESVVKIHTGGSLGGTILYTVFGGAADAAAMNSVCFDLLGVGRQDLNNGQDRLQVFFDFLGDGPCRPQIISAELEAGQPSADQHVGPTTARRFGESLVGFVAVRNLDATADPAAPMAADSLAGFTATTQAGIDRLLARGVGNIVLVSNIGLANDLALAETLTAVDAIVGGGSHSLLGEFSALGLEAEGDYPQRTVNLDGEPVCIGHAWQYARVVGELRVAFDGLGGVSGCDGEAHLLLSTVERDPVTMATIDGYTTALTELGVEPLATVTQELCFTPVPSRSVGILCSADVIGDGSRRPADVQLLIAEAIRSHGAGADIGFVNSGVVDRGLQPGPLHIEDTYGVLAGDHTMSYLEMTGAEVTNALEEAIASALAEDGSRGAYPHVAGLRWTYDPAARPGARMTDLEVSPNGDSPWVPLEPATTYTVATTAFLAGGGDGYATMAAVSAEGRVTRTFVEYSRALVEHIQQDLDGVVSPGGG